MEFSKQAQNALRWKDLRSVIQHAGQCTAGETTGEYSLFSEVYSLKGILTTEYWVGIDMEGILKLGDKSRRDMMFWKVRLKFFIYFGY